MSACGAPHPPEGRRVKRRSFIGGVLITGIMLLSAASLGYYFLYVSGNGVRPAADKNISEKDWRMPPGSAVSVIGYSDALDKQNFQGARVGGLSGLAYDGRSGLYHVVVDRKEGQTSRVYKLRLPVENGQLGEPEIFDATILRDSEGKDFGGGRQDGEGIAITSWGDMLISSEVGPTVRRFSRDGRLLQDIPIPEKFLVGSGGGRPNSTFEGLSLTPDYGSFFVAPQKSLTFDSLDKAEEQQRVRLLRYENRGLDEYQPSGEFFYLTDAAGGVSDVEALSDKELLVLESNKLYRVDVSGAKDVSNVGSLADAGSEPLKKELVADLEACVTGGPSPGSQSETPAVTYEGLTLGPTLPNGGRALLLVSDDDFNDKKTTRVLALGVWPQDTKETTGSACR